MNELGISLFILAVLRRAWAVNVGYLNAKLRYCSLIGNVIAVNIKPNRRLKSNQSCPLTLGGVGSRRVWENVVAFENIPASSVAGVAQKATSTHTS